MNHQKIYFPNLNGLRFIAAFLVIIHHIEQLKAFYEIENYYRTIPFIGIIGKLGVYLFFVLSGFLITFLLLTEEERFKTINIKQFYMRRILRIWPLYFFIIILAFFVFPYFKITTWPGFLNVAKQNDFFINFSLFMFFLPNVVETLIPFASHTWSIGTEEQFYLVWPILLKKIKKFRIFLMFSVIILYLLIATIISCQCFYNFPGIKIIKLFWGSFRIDSMAIGGIYAVLLFSNNKVIKVLKNKIFFYSILLLLILMLGFGLKFKHLHSVIYSILFGFVILNFASNKTIKISLENKVLNYLGNISYGLYMYHIVAISLSIVFCQSIDWVTNWLIYPITFILTITFAGFSHAYFETYFLKFKHKFTKINSGSKIN